MKKVYIMYLQNHYKTKSYPLVNIVFHIKCELLHENKSSLSHIHEVFHIIIRKLIKNIHTINVYIMSKKERNLLYAL